MRRPRLPRVAAPAGRRRRLLRLPPMLTRVRAPRHPTDRATVRGTPEQRSRRHHEVRHLPQGQEGRSAPHPDDLPQAGVAPAGRPGDPAQQAHASQHGRRQEGAGRDARGPVGPSGHAARPRRRPDGQVGQRAREDAAPPRGERAARAEEDREGRAPRALLEQSGQARKTHVAPTTRRGARKSMPETGPSAGLPGTFGGWSSSRCSWVSVWWLPTFVTWRTIAALANEADAARRVRARSRDRGTMNGVPEPRIQLFRGRTDRFPRFRPTQWAVPGTHERRPAPRRG